MSFILEIIENPVEEILRTVISTSISLIIREIAQRTKKQKIKQKKQNEKTRKNKIKKLNEKIKKKNKKIKKQNEKIKKLNKIKR